MQCWQLLLAWSVHVTAVLHHPREKDPSLWGFFFFSVQVFFRSRCWIWTECGALWTQATQMGLFIDWLKMLQQKWRLIRPYSLMHYCPPLTCTVLESLGVLAHLVGSGGVFRVFCTPRLWPTGAYLSYYCFSVTVLFWPLPSSSHSGPENCHLLIWIFFSVSSLWILEWARKSQ